jgi:outer membrane protein assembly factor BamB
MINDMRTKRVTVLGLLLLAGTVLPAQERVEWRYDRTGVYSKESGLLKSWPEGGPELLWHYQGLGNGFTSVTIDKEQLFVTGETDEKGYLYVMNMDGKLQRKIEYGTEWVENYQGTRNAVIPNDGKLYIVSGVMELFCYDMQSLNLLWKKNYARDFGAKNTQHGWHGTPLIVGEKLIIAPGGAQHNVVALNKETGELIWSSTGAGVMSGYGSPIYLSDQQVPQVVFMMADFIIGLDVSNGRVIWSYPHTNRLREHPNTPVYHNNMLQFMSSYGKGSTMLRLVNGGRSVEKVWELTDMMHMTGHTMKFGDYLYGPGDGTHWYCVDWHTGEIMYSDTRLSVGNIISADGMLYIYTNRGVVALIKPNSQRLDIVSSFSLAPLGTGGNWSHPVIHKGIMYVRHGDALMAYRVK